MEIQIKANVEKTFSKSYHSRQKYLPFYSDPGILEKYNLKFPSKYRHLRALIIAAWFFPQEVIGWKIIFDLQDKLRYFSLDLEGRGVDLTIEIRLLLDSKESCLNYLKSEISSNELFGNILRSDLSEALKILHFYRKSDHVQRKIRRRGYNDKGSRRDESKWIESHDYSFTEFQNYRETLQLQIDLLILLKKRIYSLQI